MKGRYTTIKCMDLVGLSTRMVTTTLATFKTIRNAARVNTFMPSREQFRRVIGTMIDS